MEITYIGHACFLVKSSQGLRILLDPYEPGGFSGRLGLGPFKEAVDIVVCTHEHMDHSYVDPAFGNPAVVRQPCTVSNVKFDGFRLPHDPADGALRGHVTGFRFTVDGLVLFHPGDVGRPLLEKEAKAIRPVDILFLPTGGTFTVDAAGALEVMRALSPAVVIPMHYAHPRVKLPLAPLDDFLALLPRHERVGKGPLVMDQDHLPRESTVFVMDPTR